ncbi:hypothetical protein [Vulgatibacter incomptus]|uniref:Phosphoesterase n=1 Tax=Vulgatibacter incomptus TaxID=1391653 RepID=A0A0K1P8Y2_9BACT|nr:hypothetical protein [Vulgatibacter incomptus]AKU89967.1 hypothetical protein AKJ08_0354 [Vulgatibacter incomptus]
MRLKVCYHDNCFDGLSSAAVFTRFFLECVDPSAEVEYQGLAHRAGDPFGPDLFDGDVNAVVDFRYTQSPRLDWYFDHHVSAFQEEGDEAHFRADASGKKFWDPEAKSCTKFLARVAKAKFGFDPTPMQHLIDWADLIDSAKFPSAKAAVELEGAALQLMTLIEAEKDPAVLHGLIRRMQHETLESIAVTPEIRAKIDELLARHRRNVELIRERVSVEGGIVFYDIADQGIDNVNKFIPYYLHPECRYGVNVTASKKRAKVSIGTNPWATFVRTHDLAKMAEKYGGGGHPVVAAISFPPDQLERARAVAAELAAKLRT